MICASGEVAGTATNGTTDKTATALVVRDYAQTFETPGGRRRKGAAPYVALPTRHDGKRFRRVAKLERGAEVYAAWCLILAVAARCPRRGVLMDERGEPLTAEDLSDMTGFPQELFELGIEALLDERIGWLQRVPISVIEEAARQGADAAAPGVANPTPATRDGSPDTSPSRPPDGVFSPPVESKSTAAANRGGTAPTSQDPPPATSAPSPNPGPSDDEKRIAAIEEMLTGIGIRDEISPDLYRRPYVTAQLVRTVWNRVTRELRMMHPVPGFKEMLRQCAYQR